MKCSMCNDHLSNKQKCLLCHQLFCSYICIESHIILAHNKKVYQNYININNNSNNKKRNNIIDVIEEEKEIIIQSPYLIPGIFNIKRTYDQKYNLNNFISVYEKSRPKVIGCGSFGKVYLVMHKRNKKHYAIKHMEKKKIDRKIK